MRLRPVMSPVTSTVFQAPSLNLKYTTTPRIRPHITAPKADRKSTRLNSSHLVISYAVFCLKKKSHVIGRSGRRASVNQLGQQVHRARRIEWIADRSGPDGDVDGDRGRRTRPLCEDDDAVVA